MIGLIGSRNAFHTVKGTESKHYVYDGTVREFMEKYQNYFYNKNGTTAPKFTITLNAYGNIVYDMYNNYGPAGLIWVYDFNVPAKVEQFKKATTGHKLYQIDFVYDENGVAKLISKEIVRT